MTPDEPRHVDIDLSIGDRIEIDRGDCACLAGQVCPDDGAFASVCPRRQHPEDALVGAEAKR